MKVWIIKGISCSMSYIHVHVPFSFLMTSSGLLVISVIQEVQRRRRSNSHETSNKVKQPEGNSSRDSCFLEFLTLFLTLLVVQLKEKKGQHKNAIFSYFLLSFIVRSCVSSFVLCTLIYLVLRKTCMIPRVDHKKQEEETSGMAFLSSTTIDHHHMIIIEEAVRLQISFFSNPMLHHSLD